MKYNTYIYRHPFRMLALLIAVCAMALTSCQSSKHASQQSGSSYAGTSLEQRFEALVEASGEWSELNVPVKIDLKEPFAISASGRAYMHRGRDIYMSLRVMGLEVAVIYINGDSIYAADKFNRRYLAEPIGEILGNASVTVADIQDLLTGRVFVNGKGTISEASRNLVDLKSRGSDWTITPKSRVANAEYSFTIDNQSNTLSKLTVKYKSKSVACTYLGAAPTTWGTFMTEARVAIPLSKESIAAGLRWSWGNAKGSVDSSVRWRTPSGYKRIDGASLLKTYAGANF